MKILSCLFFAAFTLLGCLPLQQSLHAADFLIIVDSSGSMSELTSDGQTKMQAAKQALHELKSDLSPHQLGMILFGHRTDPKMPGSCQDVETVLPISDFAEAEYDHIVGSLNPRGNTPLAASLRQAATDLTFRDKATNKIVIVVTDGNETCGGDPVAVARQMQTLGINVQIHVVGFGVKAKEQRQLRELAEAGKGKFGLANTKAGLQKIIQEQITEGATAQGPPAEKPSLSVIEKALVRKLEDENRDVRTSAAKTLLKMKSKNGVTYLCERMLKDEDYYAWHAASQAVRSLSPEDFQKTIIASMKVELPAIRIWGAESAITAGNESTPDKLSAIDAGLVEALKDGHRDVRTAAGTSLLKRKTVAAVPHLVTRLPIEGDYYAWESAFKALNGLSQDEAAEALLTALDSENATVRTWATERLASF